MPQLRPQVLELAATKGAHFTAQVPPGGGDRWYANYFDGDCQQTGDGCPNGCQRSLWSEISTWDNQRAEIGNAPLPGFKANVTIKRCQVYMYI